MDPVRLIYLSGTAPDLSTTALGREAGVSYGRRWGCQGNRRAGSGR